MSHAGPDGHHHPGTDGGQGGTLMDAVIAIEEVAPVCPRSADVVQAGNFGPIRTFAEYAHRRSRRSTGCPTCWPATPVISLGMTEPDAGSAVTELDDQRASRTATSYCINGTKVFSTHSADADVFLVYVRFGPGVGGIGSVLVERGTPGFTIGAPSDFMTGEEWCELYFDELPHPGGERAARRRRLQEADRRLQRRAHRQHLALAGASAASLQRRRASMRVTRKQFGRPLCEFQGLQWKFADMKIKLDAAQLLLYRAAANADHGLPSADETAIAKLACNQAGFEVANEAMQVMGGIGYSQESLVEYCLRRSRGWMIAGGSIEILKNRIAETSSTAASIAAPAKIVRGGR